MKIHDSYEIVQVNSKKHLMLYKDCFDNNGSPKSLDRLQWMHLNNTVNTTLVNLAVEKQTNDIGGIYAVFPCKYKVSDSIVIGTQSIDTLTDSKHRKKGLFKSLANDLYNRCINENISFVYGFPNDQSAFAFFNRLDWTEVTTVPFKILLLNTSYVKKIIAKKSKFISNLIPSLSLYRKRVKLSQNKKIVAVNRFSEITDTVWRSFSESYQVGLLQDADYMNWRIFDKPNEEYKVRMLYENDIAIAYVIYVVKSKHDGRIGYLMDFIYLQNFSKSAQDLLKYAINDMKNDNAEVILAWNLDHSLNSKNLNDVGFRKLYKWLRPIKLYFGVRVFGSDKGLDKKDNWYLSYLDSDTV